MDVVDYPGVPGLFLAVLFAGALRFLFSRSSSFRQQISLKARTIRLLKEIHVGSPHVSLDI